jgi:hypothetical protein
MNMQQSIIIMENTSSSGRRKRRLLIVGVVLVALLLLGSETLSLFSLSRKPHVVPTISAPLTPTKVPSTTPYPTLIKDTVRPVLVGL